MNLPKSEVENILNSETLDIKYLNMNITFNDQIFLIVQTVWQQSGAVIGFRQLTNVPIGGNDFFEMTFERFKKLLKANKIQFII